MAAPRKPTNVLALKGAFRKDPARGRARANEPAPDGELGPAPEHLTEVERACWVEVVSLCHANTLCRADRLIVEHCARLLAMLRGAESYDDTRLQIRFEASLGKLGLSPADRSRVSALRREEENEYAEFG